MSDVENSIQHRMVADDSFKKLESRLAELRGTCLMAAMCIGERVKIIDKGLRFPFDMVGLNVQLGLQAIADLQKLAEQLGTVGLREDP